MALGISNSLVYIRFENRAEHTKVHTSLTTVYILFLKRINCLPASASRQTLQLHVQSVSTRRILKKSNFLREHVGKLVLYRILIWPDIRPTIATPHVISKHT